MSGLCVPIAVSTAHEFASKPTVLNVFVNDEMTGRAPDFWTEYRDTIRGIGADDVLRVAETHLAPDGMAILVIGDWDEIYGGDLEGRASMNDFFGGNVQHMPTLDPLTLQPE